MPSIEVKVFSRIRPGSARPTSHLVTSGRQRVDSNGPAKRPSERQDVRRVQDVGPLRGVVHDCDRVELYAFFGRLSFRGRVTSVGNDQYVALDVAVQLLDEIEPSADVCSSEYYCLRFRGRKLSSERSLSSAAEPAIPAA